MEISAFLVLSLASFVRNDEDLGSLVDPGRTRSRRLYSISLLGEGSIHEHTTSIASAIATSTPYSVLTISALKDEFTTGRTSYSWYLDGKGQVFSVFEPRNLLARGQSSKTAKNRLTYDGVHSRNPAIPSVLTGIITKVQSTKGDDWGEPWVS